MKTPNVKGIDIELNGEKYILPPLPVKAYSKGDASEKLKSLQNALSNIGGDNGMADAFSQTNVSDLVALTTMALKRNYPEITEDQVEDGFEDIMTLFGVFQYLISQNKEVQAKMEEARKNAFKELAVKSQQNQK